MSTKIAHLIDSFLLQDKILCYFIDENGNKFYLTYNFNPTFYISNPIKDLEKYISDIETKFDVIKKREINVFKISSSIITYNKLIQKALQKKDNIQIYNIDIPPILQFYFEKNIFPLCKVKIFFKNYELKDITPLSNRFEVNNFFPPLNFLIINPISKDNPKYSKWEGIEVITLDQHLFFEELNSDFCEVIDSIFKKEDPDIIITKAGDPIIIPFLHKNNITLSRPFKIPPKFFKEKQYISYGQIVYKEHASLLTGRIHIDLKNSFFGKESGFEGIAEISRLTSMPLQEAARFSPGSAISTMELRIAFENNYLIPYEKAHPENFKSALELLEIDKGGIIFYPQPGTYKNVCEYDFFSMYPSIILKYNISIDTFKCKCCEEIKEKIKIPGTDYYFCRKKKGLIPMTIEPILKQREILKEKGYENRQIALKWMLVTCFGYLGYKNAKFGCVEAHEATTALSRELLLKAKEIIEENGFKFLHAIVDSLWCYKESANELDYKILQKKISKHTGFKINFEGIYKFLKILPSKSKKNPVPNKFFGIFTNGKIKVRGLMLRRRDTPEFIKEFQIKAIKNIKIAEKIYQEYLNLLKNNQIPIDKLAIKRKISKTHDEYKVKNIGFYLTKYFPNINPGESVKYVVSNKNSKILEEKIVPLNNAYEFDLSYYEELLKTAYEEIILD